MHHTDIITINARFNPPKGILGALSKKLYESTLSKIDHIYCKSKNDVDAFKKYVDEKKVSFIGNIKHALVNNNVISEKIIEKSMSFLHPLIIERRYL